MRTKLIKRMLYCFYFGSVDGLQTSALLAEYKIAYP